MLWKESAFTVVAILSLARGTGANATMFSLVNSMMLPSIYIILLS